MSKEKKSKLSVISDVLSINKRTDEELMLSFQQGNKKSFEKLYERYKGPIYNYVFQMIQRGEKSQELTQDIFIKVYQKKEQFEGRSKFSTWLWSIARFSAIDFLRKKENLEIPSSTFHSDEDDENLIERIESPLPSADEQMITKDNKLKLESCLNELPVTQREAILLRIMSEQNYEEIASNLNSTLSAVKSLINRAKKALIVCMRRGDA